MTDTPIVTVAMASYNASAFIETALRSVLSQSLASLEVVVVDDASTDDSTARIAAIAREDPRVRLAVLSENRGPAGARNRALELARGEWFAVVDSDDLLHPSRLQRLIDQATADQADMIADDLLVFDDAARGQAARFLRGKRRRCASWIGLADYLRETRMLSRAPNLGYLKPIIRLDRLRASGVRYDETLRIAEDDDLVIRLLSAGLRYRLEPFPSYLYRKHSGSISHRLTDEALDRMAAAQERARDVVEACGPAAAAGLRARRSAILDAKAFVGTVEALKAVDPVRAVAAGLRRPAALRHFRLVAEGQAARLARLLKPEPPPAPAASPKRVCVISRQRLVGSTNGSSAYLLDLVRTVRDAGLEPHLLQPSPGVLGRWPILRLKPEMEVFASIRIRGVWRLGPLVISRNPDTYVAAGRAGLAAGFRRLGLPADWLGAKPAAYAIAAPWSAEDLVYVAREAPLNADRIILDYMFQGEAIGYALRPDSPSAIVMHDLFHGRTSGFEAQAASDSTVVVDEAAELGMLARADAVIAIQKAEADFVRSRLAKSSVILAPIAAKPVTTIAPGEDDTLLFVGSGTAPNVLGLQWLFDKVWPTVHAARPRARLRIAGNVSRAFAGAPEGVQFLGPVGDLGPLYDGAGVVISPLNTGSGLKIKLIEAIAQGKAVVATTVTLQGVEAELGPCVSVADEPDAFAQALIGLLGDRAARADLAERALSAARAQFSAEACYRDFVAWLGDAPTAAGSAAETPDRR